MHTAGAEKDFAHIGVKHMHEMLHCTGTCCREKYFRYIGRAVGGYFVSYIGAPICSIYVLNVFAPMARIYIHYKTLLLHAAPVYQRNSLSVAPIYTIQTFVPMVHAYKAVIHDYRRENV